MEGCPSILKIPHMPGLGGGRHTMIASAGSTISQLNVYFNKRPEIRLLESEAGRSRRLKSTEEPPRARPTLSFKFIVCWFTSSLTLSRSPFDAASWRPLSELWLFPMRAFDFRLDQVTYSILCGTGCAPEESNFCKIPDPIERSLKHRLMETKIRQYFKQRLGRLFILGFWHRSCGNLPWAFWTHEPGSLESCVQNSKLACCKNGQNAENVNVVQFS